MRRRLLIARALVHQPRLVLLDEPTVGLDPQVRQELWALIDALRAEGVSILMSTHYIEEAERLADTVTIMAEGKAVATGRPSELVREHVGREAIEVYGPPARLAEAEAEARAAGFNTRRTGNSVSVLGVERANGDAPEGERRPANLEDVFVLLTGEEASDRRARALASAGSSARRSRACSCREVINFSSFWRSSDVLLDRRADDLPARVRLRLRLARRRGRRLRLRRVRRHRHGRDRGAVLVGLRGDVRHVREVPVPAHLRRDPRRAGRHRGARHRRGAVDRARAPASSAARRCSSPWCSGSTRAGACCSSRSSAR